MLDTRNIELFTNPKKLIDSVNPDLHGRTLSAWSMQSTNMVMTQLLAEHAGKVTKDSDSFRKLLTAYRAVGLREGTQLFVLAYNRSVCFFEPISKSVLRVMMGAVLPNGSFRLITSTDVVLFPEGYPENIWFKSTEPVVPNTYQNLKGDTLEKMLQTYVSAATSFYIYLTLIEIETVIIQPKEKFKAKKYEGFKNQQNIPIAVADLSWSRETVVALPFGVCGHLRNQRVGAGRMDSKLIYIEPFAKTGYHKKSGKDRILK